MHYKDVKGILLKNNGMNIYRGCLHNCIYCDSRSKCYEMDHEFTDVLVKQNALSLLEKALISKREKCMIGTGSMSDPYMQLEKELLYSRKALELILKYGFGATMITKSDLILRDLDLIKKINGKAKFVLQMTLTTYDEDLCKIIEPHVCTTKRRVEVLKIFNEHQIKTVVWLSPLLPYINDTKENLLGILNYCKEANVYGIIFFGIGLTLREGNREYFYEKLDKHFPGLKDKYIQEYHHNYNVLSKNNNELKKLFIEFCNANNIICNNDYLFTYLSDLPSKYEQLSLFK